MEIVFTKQAKKDFERLKEYPSLLKKARALLSLLEENPLQTPPSYERLKGFENVYSRKLSIRHDAVVYQVYEAEKTVKIIRMWTHYE